MVNQARSAESRHVALKIMLACDMGPKFAMPLILAPGPAPGLAGGMLSLSGGAVALAWAVCLYWFCVVLVLFVSEANPSPSPCQTIDFYFRIVVVLVILKYATSVLVNNPLAARLAGPPGSWSYSLPWSVAASPFASTSNLSCRPLSRLMSKGASEIRQPCHGKIHRQLRALCLPVHLGRPVA